MQQTYSKTSLICHHSIDGASARLDPVATKLHADDAQPTNEDSLRGLAWNKQSRTKSHSAPVNPLDH